MQTEITKRKIAKALTTHNLSGTHFYRAFMNLRSRCRLPWHISYKYYGKRGIKCLWNSFQEFMKDMYQSYLEHVENFGEKNTTIDRIDNNGNYSPENCRWVTKQEQTLNKRSNKYLIYKGVMKYLSGKDEIDVLLWERWPSYDFIFGIPAKGNKLYGIEAGFFQYRNRKHRTVKAGFYVDLTELHVLLNGFKKIANCYKHIKK